MNIFEGQTAMPVRTATANSAGMACAKAIALEAAQTLFGTARDALLAYAMTGSAVASIVVVAGPRERWPQRNRDARESDRFDMDGPIVNSIAFYNMPSHPIFAIGARWNNK